ncbi:MAG: DNA alkylation repair protein [Anaerolineae bacterium]
MWASGNHDARVLALDDRRPGSRLTAPHSTVGARTDNYVIVDAFSSFVGSSPLARQKAEQWIESDDEWTGDAGWSLIGQLARKTRRCPMPTSSRTARIERDRTAAKTASAMP